MNITCQLVLLQKTSLHLCHRDALQETEQVGVVDQITRYGHDIMMEFTLLQGKHDLLPVGTTHLHEQDREKDPMPAAV